MKDNCSSCLIIRFEPFEQMSESLGAFLDSYFEVSSLDYLENGTQQYIAYADSSFDNKHFESQAHIQGILLPPYSIEAAPDKNWLKETSVAFAPFETSDFCIYGIHENKPPKTKKIRIQINAETAFGSTHHTTCLCLKALSDLSCLNFSPERILDVGTGSGILSVAVAKKFHQNNPTVISVDIDSESVNVAAQNALNNRVSKFMTTAYSNGFRAEIVQHSAPYDLIFTNIFARPLISMAKDMAHNLKPKGYAILSGFTDEQTSWVLQAYEKHGFKCIQTYLKNHWCAAIVQKKESIADLQTQLEPHQAFLVQRNNMFLSEDVLQTENKILELSGFTGSAGMLLILRNKALLLVDGRYTIQAKKEVLKSIEVCEVQSFWNTLISVLHHHQIQTLRVNPWCISESTADLFQQNNFNIQADVTAPASSISLPKKIFKHQLKFAGISSQDKAHIIANKMPQGVDALLLTSAEEVSWLANLRAFDLPCSPVLRAFALLKKDGHLKIYQSHQIKTFISDLKKCHHLIYQKSQTPLALRPYIQNAEDIGFDVVSKQKLQKNPTEIQGFINAHVRDGVAMVKFLYWLSHKTDNTSELDIVQELHQIRARGKRYFSESFETIAAVDSNAAIVHYQPTAKTSKYLKKNSLCLIDSGAQYFDGTTDITRTVAFGRISSKLKHDFTLVLKAHIALASHTFQTGTLACTLDTVCRNVMNSQNKDFKHGTGHSVGHFSNVHEPPFSINAANQTPVLENYITSIEPGLYIEGKYGIRIENLYYTKKTQQDGFLCFEPLTLCPIDLNLVEQNLLTNAEKSWLNAYHQRIFDALKPFLNKKERLWLQEKCRDI